MYGPMLLRIRRRELEFERRRALQLAMVSRTPHRKTSIRTAMSLSVAFAAGWLAASIF
jgi:hypothetical protein